MSDRLPPLTALRAFEAAARHMSFANAAAELHVTPAALSFQIKSLEDHLGAPVFRRLNRAVELTEEGALLQPGVAEGFAALQGAWRAVQRRVDRTSLTIAAGPAFTAKWLAPRLFSFASSNPDIDLKFSASLKLMDFERDDIDVAIRFGQGVDKSLYSLPVIDEWAAPMVAPEIANDIRSPKDFLKVPLLHQEDIGFLRPKLDWPSYLEAEGVGTGTLGGVKFSQADHAIDAALAGGGAVLGRISLADSHLKEGRLVMPFSRALKAHAGYWIVCLPGAQARPQVARFIDWILSETAAIKAWDEKVSFLDRM